MAGKRQKERRTVRQYSDIEKRQAIGAYLVTGSTTKTAEITGIPDRTLRGWRAEPWWGEYVEEIRQEKDEELDAMLTETIHLAGSQVKDRIENGDYVLDRDGNLKRRPMGGKDLAMVQAIQYDKRQLIRNLPTAISSGGNERLRKLMEQFEKYAKAKQVEGEVVGRG